MVEIYSKINIKVFPDVTFEERKEVINPGTGAKSRIITQNWSGKGVLIKEGDYKYEDYILEFGSVKKLLKQGLLKVLSKNKKPTDKKEEITLSELKEDGDSNANSNK